MHTGPHREAGPSWRRRPFPVHRPPPASAALHACPGPPRGARWPVGACPQACSPSAWITFPSSSLPSLLSWLPRFSSEPVSLCPSPPQGPPVGTSSAWGTFSGSGAGMTSPGHRARGLGTLQTLCPGGREQKGELVTLPLGGTILTYDLVSQRAPVGLSPRRPHRSPPADTLPLPFLPP